MVCTVSNRNTAGRLENKMGTQELMQKEVELFSQTIKNVREQSFFSFSFVGQNSAKPAKFTEFGKKVLSRRALEG